MTTDEALTLVDQRTEQLRLLAAMSGEMVERHHDNPHQAALWLFVLKEAEAAADAIHALHDGMRGNQPSANTGHCPRQLPGGEYLT